MVSFFLSIMIVSGMHAISSTYIIMSSVQDEVADKSDLGEEHKYEITESMRVEMEYDADRAW